MTGPSRIVQAQLELPPGTKLDTSCHNNKS